MAMCVTGGREKEKEREVIMLGTHFFESNYH